MKKNANIYVAGHRGMVGSAIMEELKENGYTYLTTATRKEVDPCYFRPTEVELLIGDPTEAQEKLGWKPNYDLQGLLKDMVQSDLMLFQKDLDLKEAGHKVLRQAE